MRLPQTKLTGIVSSTQNKMAKTRTSPAPQCGERPPKRTKYDYTETVAVLVGEEQKRFTVHKNIICRSSEFFDTAVNTVKSESDEDSFKIVCLDETAPETFGVYLAWLYSGKVDVRDESDGAYQDIDDHSTANRIQRDLINAYILGNSISDRSFRNAVVDEIKESVEERDTLVSSGNVKHLSEHMPQKSKLSQMLIDYCVTDFSYSEFETVVHNLPTDFVIEIAKTCIREKDLGAPSRKPKNRPRCHYHEHPDEEEC